MYLKRIATPKEWPILRKEKKYVVSESYDLKRALPLGFILRDMLGLGTNMREIKKILNQGKIEIDGKKVYNLKYPVTIFNIIKTSDGKKYKLEIKNRKFKIEESKEDKVPLRVIGKKTIEKGKIQLNLVSGKNVLTNRKDIKINDSIVLEGNKIAKHFPLKKGCIIKNNFWKICWIKWKNNRY